MYVHNIIVNMCLSEHKGDELWTKKITYTI